jgi:hypothetical protein
MAIEDFPIPPGSEALAKASNLTTEQHILMQPEIFMRSISIELTETSIFLVYTWLLGG